MNGLLAKIQSYLHIGKIRNIPIYMQWTVPITAIILVLFYGPSWKTAPFFVLGYLIVILVHELGHAFLARFYGLDVIKIEFVGSGGLCYYKGSFDYLTEAKIAWGGALAQLALLFAAILWINLIGNPTGIVFGPLFFNFTIVNVILLFFNSFPKEGHDGKIMWSVPKVYLKKIFK